MTIVYAWVSLLALTGSIIFWSRRASTDSRLVVIYVAALCGAMVGAGLGYSLAEGWFRWRLSGVVLDLVSGKTIVGGLIGGFLSVELVKRILGYTRVTGDLFATVVPLSIALGRVGCLYAGCCPGRICELSWYTLSDMDGTPRWPAVPLELLFNLSAAAAFLHFRSKQRFTGQHFHLYMMGYGVFRFCNEFMRDDLIVVGVFTGYHLQAAMLFLLGALGYSKRQRLGELRD